MSRDIIKEDDDEIDIVEDKAEGEHLEIEEDDRRQVASDEDSGTDDEREAVRERRRQEKRERKQRQEEARKRDKTELTFLQRRNEELERRFSQIEGKLKQNEISGIDAAIADAARRAQLAEEIFAKAISAKNGEDASKAMQYRDQARAAVAALQQRKAQEAYAMQQQAQAAAAPSPKQVQLAQEFIRDHAWYDPDGQDEDSAIVLAVDQALAREKMDPNTEEYWEELRERVRKRLPEKFEQRKERTERSDTSRPRGGPQIGSGRGDGGAPSGRREVYISPERKQAMMEAGVWDDPILRNKYIKRYMEYDRQNSR